ncbi:MAG TPA: neutral zinc metallopeptidase [Longimicrobium sp.]|nr:neutral zinc metallopeptidase [Longimicrobium sp.]
MRWQGRGGSGNIEDRRGMGGGGMAAGGGIGAVVLGLIYFLLTGDPSGVQMPAGGGAEQQGQTAPVDPATDTLGQFVSTVLRDTEITWGQLFQQAGETYQEPRLVLFSNRVQSACGSASTAVGPFYCPGDQKVYIDLAFYDQMRRQLDAPGDFAQAYVIAHEVGHHVQTITGVSQQVNAASQRVGEAERNRLSVMQELQADCYAGVWAHHAEARQPWLEPGDIEEALNAASAIGDDTLQRKMQGEVQPETFTHGTSAQRVRWFRRGFDTGDVDQCNTFEAASL